MNTRRKNTNAIISNRFDILDNDTIYAFNEFCKLLNFINIQLTDHSIYAYDEYHETVLFIGNLPDKIGIFHKINIQNSKKSELNM